MCAGRIEIIDHTADVAVRFFGDDLEILFRQGLRGLYELIGEPVSTGQTRTETLTLTADSVDLLFHDWLNELLYRFDVRETVFTSVTFDRLEPTVLEATLTGGKIDPERSTVDTEIKAVTYHQLDAKQVDDEWQATVVFDI